MKKICLIFLTFIFCFQLHASKIYTSDAMVLDAGKSTALEGGKTNTRKEVDEPISALSPVKIPGLTNGASYIPALSAVNAVGVSVNSAAITASPVSDGPVCDTYTNKTTANGLGNAQVNGVYVTGSTFYAATEGGLSISTDGGSTFTNKTTTHGLGSNTVYGVYAIGTTVYAATTGGLSISTDGGSTFTNKTTTHGLGSNIVNGVYVFGSTVYAATNGGLSISTDGGNIFTNKIIGFSYFVNGVYVIDSNVYAATNGGLAISTDGGTIFTVKTTTDGLGNNILTGVYAIGNTVYAATEGGLSISINGGNTFTNKTTTDGLGNNILTGVYVIGSTVYAATINGLSISTDGGGSFTNYKDSNGLGSTVVYDVYAIGSSIYAATQSGLSFCMASVPSAPTSLSAVAGNGQLQISFTAGANGGNTITNYEYTLNGGTTWTALNPVDGISPVTISGLTNGTSYTLALRAVNALGRSVASASVTAIVVTEASNLTIDPIPIQTYTGSALTPAIVVKDGATTLTEGTHYSVAYSNNTNEGTATVTITGLGNPTGTKTVTFGITMWTARTSAADNSWISVTYGNGLFVAIAGSGTGNRVMTSPDGITWTARTSAADLGWFSVTYGNGLFVAVATTGTGNRVMTSPDGINWTSRLSAADNTWNSVTYGNGLFVAVAGSGAGTVPGNQVMTSPDGITWTSRTAAMADNYWYDVTYGNGLFVAVAATGAGNRVMTSPDGITWTARTSAADNIWSSVTYGNGLFVAVAATGAGNRVMTSPDGITWTARTSAADNFWWGLTYGNGLFVAVSFSGTGNRVMTSPDGITWTAQTPAADNNWYGVTYGNGLFVAVGNTGTGNRVMTLNAVVSRLTIDAIANQTFTGSALTPTIVVKDDATTLTEGTHYSVAYSNNTNVGTATVTISGRGNYTGTKTQTFSIARPTMSIVSGNNQSGAVNQALADSPIIKVFNPDGTPAANVSLTVSASAGQISRPVLSNLSYSYTTGGTTLTNNSWKAYQFTTGNTSLTLDQVEVVLNSFDLPNLPYPYTAQVEAAIFTVVNDSPANEIGSSGLQSVLLSATATWKTLEFTSPIELTPNTTYAFVLKSNSTGVKWANAIRPEIQPAGSVTFVNVKSFYNSTWNSVRTNNSPLDFENAFILKGSTSLNTTQTLVTNSNGTVGLGSWVLGDRAGTQELVVTNASLSGSPLTITATATAVVPSAPTTLSYTSGNGQVSLSFTPGYDGGSAITNYEYSLDNGSAWAPLSPVDVSSPITISGLSDGVTYPLRIRAVNTAGSGVASAAINVIALIPLSYQSITIDAIASQTYTGSAITPTVVVKDGATTLTETTAYTVAYTSNTNVGTATVTITGTGNYSGTKAQTFGIVAKAASTLTIDPIADQTYTGAAITPLVVVKDGTITLTLGTDYSVAYSNNTNVGTATVTITGTGNYTGTKTQTFSIVAKAASTLTIEAIANQTYTGSALTPAIVVKDGATTLTLGTHYSVAYSNNTNVGTATVTITGTGNYTGTKTQTFSIVAKAASTLTIEVIANQTYTGSAITPTVVVKDGSTTLTLGTDYTVAYSSNTNVGTATVTITGTGNYTGTKTQTFSIVAKAASTLTIEAIANQTYTGSALTPAIVVKDGATTLTLGTHYSVAYSNNTNVGTATVTITGTGNYTGTKTQTFSIVAKAASTLTIEVIANQTYTGSAITPTVVVKDGSTTLTLGTDYTVAYSSNTNVGTATVTIMGTGNYSGDNSQTFAILPKAVILQANNASKIFGDANPSLSFSYSGLVAGDTEIDQVPVISTTASTTSGVGNYPITLTGGSDPNYSLTLVEGVLQVSPAPLSLVVNNATKVYGQADPVYTYSLLGLKGSDTDAVLDGAFTRETGEDPGTYRISQGSLSAGANYTLTVTGASLQILKAKVSSVAQLALLTTPWSKEPALPATVKVLAAHGQDFQVEVKWDKSTLNLLARGTYSLTGTLILPAGIENPNQVFAKIQVQVFPKPAPRDVTITNNTFVGSTTQFFISVGDFKINDPVDNIHVVSLLGKGYDNTYFQIKDNILFWNSAERAAGKTTFSIVVRVTDRDGNTLDKFFEIKRTRPDFSTVTIFNTFTPNADRFNDTWGVPEVRFYEGTRISVYDRGGSRLFYTENPDVRWDGTYEGKEMPVGTYYWVIQIDETGATRRGIVNLLRK